MGWDDSPRRSMRNTRLGQPGASSRMRNVPPADRGPDGRAAGLYGAYNPNGSTRMPRPDASFHAADLGPGGWTAAELQAVGHKHHHFSLFHDGNAGHLWRGEVASLFGEAIFSTGIVVWLAYMTDSPLMVAVAVIAMVVPWLLAGPLAARLTRVQEPGAGLAWIGRLRVVLALGFIPMHFRTIYPVVFALIFAIALLGRFREALRVAAGRTCLAPGEPERVSSDIHIGAALAAVLGPLSAIVLFTLAGERVPLLAVGVAVCYLLASNSDGFLDALPPQQRAFLLAVPEVADGEAENSGLAAIDHEDEDLSDEELAQRRREMSLPEWYQLGPGSLWQGIAELRAGMALAGGARGSLVGLVSLALLALLGGAFGVLEVFYVQDRLGLPAFDLGALVAIEGTGVVLGALLGDGLTQRGTGKAAVLTGMLGAGVCLAGMAVVPFVPVALAAAFGAGVFNAIAVAGARRGLMAGFAGIERRALASAETWLSGLSGAVGAALFGALLAGSDALPVLRFIPADGWTPGELVLGSGVAVMLAGVILGVLYSAKRADADEDDEDEAHPQGTLAGLAEHDEDDYTGASSAYLPAAGGWDDDARGWDDRDEYDGYDDEPSTYGPAGPARGGRHGRGGSSGRNLRQYAAYDNGDDDDPDEPPRRSGSRYRR